MLNQQALPMGMIQNSGHPIGPAERLPSAGIKCHRSGHWLAHPPGKCMTSGAHQGDGNGSDHHGGAGTSQ